MSAVATTDSLPVSAAHPVAKSVSALSSPLEVEAAEQKRWLLWFGLPVLIAAVFVGVVFGTGQQWYLGVAGAAIVFDIGVLVWLAMSSDTNALIGDTALPAH